MGRKIGLRGITLDFAKSNPGSDESKLKPDKSKSEKELKKEDNISKKAEKELGLSEISFFDPKNSNIPTIIFYITSKKNVYGSNWNIWPDGGKSVIVIPWNDNKRHKLISIRPKKISYLSNCNESYWKCFGTMYHSWTKEIKSGIWDVGSECGKIKNNCSTISLPSTGMELRARKCLK